LESLNSLRFNSGLFYFLVFKFDAKLGGNMAGITGTVDKKPVPQAAQSKVETALKSALQAEIPTVVGTHHIEFTHIDITWDKV
jgi:hypothetical protein